jgi:predicted nucleic acid-binding protein
VKVTLDTNVLVYATDASSEHHAAAANLLERAAKAECIQTLQSLGECFHVLRRKRHLGLDVALAAVTNLRRLFPSVEHRLDDLERAIAAVAGHQIAFWDAMLWATAKRAGCRMVLTQDFQDGRDLEGVLLVNPFKPENAKLIDLALPLAGGARP